jgi:hypothetical protein
LVRNWPSGANLPPANGDSADGRVVADALVELGLLTRDPQLQSATAVAPPAATTTFGSANFSAMRFKPKPEICARFLAAYSLSAWKFKFCRLKNALDSLRRRKAVIADLCAPPTPLRLYTLMAHFFRMRALTYTSQERCVLDSLVLSDFLLRNQVLPTFVIGVSTRPFKAHCWVQSGSVVLNDSIEGTQSHTSLLAI